MAGSSFYPVTPLVAFKDPRDIFIEQPTFLGAEILFMLLAALGLVDAAFRRRGGLTFTACLVGGASVEIMAILHTEVGNFYHSQASVMLLGLREPLYMLLGCYGWSPAAWNPNPNPNPSPSPSPNPNQVGSPTAPR